MSIWRNRDFVWLISGQTISQFGSAISLFVVPWILLQLTGSAMQMGFSFAVGFLPYLILSLPAGVWADRLNRKKIMIWSDVFRALFLAIIPVASTWGHLNIWELYVTQAGLSAFSVLFDTCYVACLPNVIGREQLPQANGALQAGSSAAQILGPTMGGLLITLIGAYDTVLLDVGSFVISVLSLLVIRKSFSAVRTEPEAGGVQAKPKMWPQIREGLQYVWQHKLIRTISLFTLAINFSGTAMSAMLLFRINDELHVPSNWAGVVMSAFGVGILLGSLIVGRIGKRLSMGAVMRVSIGVLVLTAATTALFGNPLLIALAQLFAGVASVLWNVNSVSLRQSVIPDHLLGRAQSAIRMVVWASIPIGSAAGGTVGQLFGGPMVFLAGAALQLVVFAFGLATPMFNKAQTEKAMSGVGA